MKAPDIVVIMSTQSGEGSDITKSDIIEQHTNSPALGGYGFNRPGIDYLIRLDGTLDTIIQEENPTEIDLWGISDGVDGVSGLVKYMAYAGGLTKNGAKTKDTRTEEQRETLKDVVRFLAKRFPEIRFAGANQIPALEGVNDPAFDASKWLTEIGIDEANIFRLTDTST